MHFKFNGSISFTLNILLFEVKSHENKTLLLTLTRSGHPTLKDGI